MDLQEKKYLVKNFSGIQKLLADKKAPKIRDVTSVHYYGRREGNDVEKFVEYPDHCEIHVLKESGGKYTMVEHAPIADKQAGLAWLKNRGFNKANVVKMDYSEYAYKNGVVGLYIIDDLLFSVILSFTQGKHNAVEKDFGLQGAENITVPYNKYLEKLGKLHSINL